MQTDVVLFVSICLRLTYIFAHM